MHSTGNLPFSLARLSAALAAFTTAGTLQAQSWTLHVVPEYQAPPGSMGETWNAAYGSIQHALDRAKEIAEAPLDDFGFQTERKITIKMTTGTHRPSIGSDIGSLVSIAPTTSSVTLDLRGGFNLRVTPTGFEEVFPSPFGSSVISGDVLGNDDPEVPSSYDDNVPLMLLDFGGTGSQARIKIENIIFENGRGSVHYQRGTLAFNSAAGLSVVSDIAFGSPSWHRVLVDMNLGGTFNNNKEGGFAGALFLHNAILDAQGAYFRDNSAGGAGAIWSNEAWIFLNSCVFERNQGTMSGAVFSVDRMDIYGCSFFDNRRTGRFDRKGGGAVASLRTPHIQSSRFINNSSEESGGAVWVEDGCVVRSSFFAGNTAREYGGAVANLTEAYGTVFADNSAIRGGGALWTSSPFLLLSACTLYGNSAPIGGAVQMQTYAPFAWFVLDLGLMLNNSGRNETIALHNSSGPMIGYSAWSLIASPEWASLPQWLSQQLEPGVTLGSAVLRRPDGEDTSTLTYLYNSYRLAAFSPGIDIAPPRIGRDIDGNGDGVPGADAGAYEYTGPLPGCPTDFDLDGEVGFGDFLVLLDWLNAADLRGDIADEFGFMVNEGGGPDGQIDFGDIVALLGLIGPC